LPELEPPVLPEGTAAAIFNLWKNILEPVNKEILELTA
jgi:hypothetical protein